MPPAEKPLWRAALAGSCGGVCCTLVGQPFDTVKVRVQAGQPVNRLMFQGLFSGVASPLLFVTPFWTISYFSYRGTLNNIGADPSSASFLDASIGGFVAGAVSGIVRGSVDNIKGNAQLKSCSSLSAFRQLHAENGMRAVTRGTLATVIFSAPTQAVHYNTWEWFRQNLPEEHFGPFWRSLVSGWISGITGWAIGMPLDVIRQRIYAGEFSTMGQAARGIHSRYGWRGFFKGVVPTLLRAGPANGAAFAGISAAERWLQYVCDC